MFDSLKAKYAKFTYWLRIQAGEDICEECGAEGDWVLLQGYQSNRRVKCLVCGHVTRISDAL